MDMDISMDIHEKSVDMDKIMDMDVIIFHIHGNLANVTLHVPRCENNVRIFIFNKMGLNKIHVPIRGQY